MRILHTNDLHGALPGPTMARLRELREAAELYVDTGDLIRTGNLGFPLRREPAWAALAELRCDAGTLGNRESHVLEGAFAAKIEGAGHPLICANLRRKDGTLVFPASIVLERAGRRVGLVGTMVPMVTARMATAALSAFLWEAPIPSLVQEAERLRPDVDLLFALTHVGHRTDVAIAELGVVDAIFGGHSHTVLTAPERVNGTWIAQGGSHARFAGVYEWRDGELEGGLVPLR